MGGSTRLTAGGATPGGCRQNLRKRFRSNKKTGVILSVDDGTMLSRTAFAGRSRAGVHFAKCMPRCAGESASCKVSTMRSREQNATLSLNQAGFKRFDRRARDWPAAS